MKIQIDVTIKGLEPLMGLFNNISIAANSNTDEKTNTEKEVKAEETVPVAPVAEIAYTFEQLQNCAGQLVKAGKREDLLRIIQDMGVKSILDLPKDKFNDFAKALREIGGVL